ncbi:inositol monophosphatase family protein [Palleronia pelagia]|uniref:Inositol-1-monophosphatase n=1 Tax=Palleronia pelagia TaxID=387096 RepID=A0A1H8DDS7_9RHOB|nr:inositol monophosphatase family protein [Palleronia pelagia]SEN05419.1 myo-inositol-1(or 4)-monophosphatase [Palleronia pelagia]
MSGREEDLALAVELAREAGDILRHHWQNRATLQPQSKRAGDFVSQADLASERHLRDRLQAARPRDGWLGEETGAGAPAPRRWIVDPLDGTTNFLHGLGHFAVSIALEDDGGLALGVVHDPLRGETFAATRDGPATLNGAPIAPSPGGDMTAALFGTGIPFGDMPHIDDHAADIARIAPHCAGVRRFGAAALDLAYVAAGRLDGFWERRLQPWDIAAGIVLLRAAGARVESWTPDGPPETTGDVIAAGPDLFTPFARIIRGG